MENQNNKPIFFEIMEKLEKRCDELFEAVELNQLSADHARVECKTMYRNAINAMRYPGESKFNPWQKTEPNTQILNQ